MYERMTPVSIIVNVNTEQVITICSMNHVSEHEILKRENASQPKWSMALE